MSWLLQILTLSHCPSISLISSVINTAHAPKLLLLLLPRPFGSAVVAMMDCLLENTSRVKMCALLEKFSWWLLVGLGLRFWFLGSGYERDCYIGVVLESQTTNPNQQLTMSWKIIECHLNNISKYLQYPSICFNHLVNKQRQNFRVILYSISKMLSKCSTYRVSSKYAFV